MNQIKINQNSDNKTQLTVYLDFLTEENQFESWILSQITTLSSCTGSKNSK